MPDRKRAERRETSPVVEMLFVIGGIGLVFAAAIAAVLVRARRRRIEYQANAEAQAETRREVAEARRRPEEDVRLAAEKHVQHQAEEARRRAEEEAHTALDQAEGAHRRSHEEARAAADREMQHQGEEARRPAEEEARVAIQPEAALEAAAVREDAPVRHVQSEMRPTQASRAAQTARPQAADALGGPLGAAAPGVVYTLPQVAPPSAVLAAPPLTPRSPREYRLTVRSPAPSRAPASPSPEREAREHAMPIEVRLVFEKGDFCRVSLLPRRAAAMPAEFAVEGSGSPPDLQALQDEWYQEVVLPDLGHLLREGIEWVGALPSGAAGRLSLSGRAIYVLARHNELNGLVSTPRLVLGEEHVVLCIAERLQDVRAAIALTESPEPIELNSDSGIPAGWVGLRGVRPKKPVAPSPSGDIIDALRPLPDVEIALTGGIPIDRQTWLTGFPPTIQLLGDTSSLPDVTIDGQSATRSVESGYVAPGWDSPGEHTVWCVSASRTYTIRSGVEAWEPWDAYTWSLGQTTSAGTQSRPAICGVLVRPPRVARSHSRAVVVAASNPILIGAQPGDFELCTPRGDVRARLCVGFPWFEPIWALPADALHCDKRSARVLLFGSPAAVASGDPLSGTYGGGRAARRRALAWGSHLWCEAILAAGRKGLKTEPSRIEIADLWESYKRYAKALRKSSR